MEAMLNANKCTRLHNRWDNRCRDPQGRRDDESGIYQLSFTRLQCVYICFVNARVKTDTRDYHGIGWPFAARERMSETNDLTKELRRTTAAVTGCSYYSEYLICAIVFLKSTFGAHLFST
jgi:hypothetical protein